MRVWKVAAMMLIALAMLGACDSDDPTGGEPVQLPQVFTGKRVTKIQYTRGLTAESEKLVYDADGKLIKFTYVESETDGRYDEVYNIVYSGNQMKATSIYHGSKDKEEYVYTLDANGYATSAVWTSEEEDGGVMEKYTAKLSFKYKEGYLTEIVAEEDGEREIVRIQYTNGNVTSYSKDGETIACEASDILNKGGILPPNEGWIGAADGDLAIAYYAGILGKPTTNLVKANDGDSYEYVMKDEYVEKCTVMSYGMSREVFSYSFE